MHGFGEVYGVPFQPGKVAQLIEDVVERYVIGWDPFKIEKLWRIVYSSGYTQHPDLTLVGVLSGIEIACWDIIGKASINPFITCSADRFTRNYALTPTCTPYPTRLPQPTTSMTAGYLPTCTVTPTSRRNEPPPTLSKALPPSSLTPFGECLPLIRDSFH